MVIFRKRSLTDQKTVAYFVVSVINSKPELALSEKYSFIFTYTEYDSLYFYLLFYNQFIYKLEETCKYKQ